MARRCRSCPNLTDSDPWCEACAPDHVKPFPQHTTSASARGYDKAWQRVRLQVLNRDGWTCKVKLKCNGAKADTVDHIVSLNAGGARLDPSNCQAACRACNSAKGDRTLAPGGRVKTSRPPTGGPPAPQASFGHTVPQDR